MGDAGLEEYRRQKNARSLDGLPTGLVDEEFEPLSAPVSSAS
jgi:hypothetical protein